MQPGGYCHTKTGGGGVCHQSPMEHMERERNQEMKGHQERIIRFNWGTKRENFFSSTDREKMAKKQGHLRGTYMYTSV